LKHVLKIEENLWYITQDKANKVEGNQKTFNYFDTIIAIGYSVNFRE